MATSDSLLNRFVPLFDHTHDAVTTAIVVGLAALLGLYASWMVADFGIRFPVFVLAAVTLGYLLYGQTTRRRVIAGGLYSLAGLVALSPLVYELAFLAESGRPGVGSPWRHVLSTADLLLFVAFFVVASVPAVVAYRVTSGPFVPRIRARLSG